MEASLIKIAFGIIISIALINIIYSTVTTQSIIASPQLRVAKQTDRKPYKIEMKYSKSKDTKPKDTKPKDTKPKDTKPKDTKPKDTKPKDTKRKVNPNNPVNHVIHQSWKTHNLPTNRSKRWSESWKSCFPNWEWKLWSDDDNLALIRRHYPWFLPVYKRFSTAVERADVSRYFYMYHHGGIYTDLDNVCLRNFAPLLANASLVFSGMEGLMANDKVLHTYIQNSFMASTARHPFWLRVISRVMLHQHHGKKGRPEFTTGPYVLMEELRDYISGHKDHDVVIYSSNYFNPFSWFKNKVKVPACKNLGDMTDADEKACIAAHPKAYVIQFHTQSWLRGRL